MIKSESKCEQSKSRALQKEKKNQGHLKAPCAPTLGATLPLPHVLTSARRSAPRTAGGSGLSGSWGLTLTLGQSTRGPSPGAWSHSPRDGGPLTPALGSACPPAANRSLRGAAEHARLSLQTNIQENRQGPRAPSDFDGPQRHNTWDHATTTPRHNLRPLLQSPHGQRIRPAGLLGPNPNPRLAAKGLGTPEPKRWTQPATVQPPWGPRSAAQHSGRENGQVPPSTRQNSMAPRATTLGPTLPLPDTFTLASCLAHHPGGRSGLLRSWGLTLNFGRGLRGPLLGAWCSTA